MEFGKLTIFCGKNTAELKTAFFSSVNDSDARSQQH